MSSFSRRIDTSQLTFGVKPLKKAPIPSVLTISRIMVIPPTCELKLAFWIRVLTTSNGEATVIEATAPAMEATKSVMREGECSLQGEREHG